MSAESLISQLAAADPAKGVIPDDAAAQTLLARVLASGQPMASPRRRADRARRSGGSRFPRPLIIALLSTLGVGLGAVALAATGVIKFGSPVKSSASLSNPQTGLGALKPGASRLLGLRVADPAGGPPWGMELIRTTRGIGCIEVGRVVHDRLGTLGIDGAFGNDGLFHPYPARGVVGGACANLDANGRLFETVGSARIAAAGLGEDGSCLTPPPVGAKIIGPGAKKICSASEMRTLSYGLLGPDATRMTYRIGGHERTLIPTRPYGAYLIVGAAGVREHRGHSLTPLQGIGPGGSAPSIMPRPWSSPVTTVTYNNGSVCRIAATHPGTLAGQCTPVGYKPLKAVPPSPAQVASTLHASVIHTPAARRAQLASPWAIRVTFIAHVPVSNASNSYEIVEATSSPEAVFNETKRNIKAGETVSFLLPAHWPGVYSGKVVYGSAVAPDYPIYTYGAGPLVGSFEIRAP